MMGPDKTPAGSHPRKRRGILAVRPEGIGPADGRTAGPPRGDPTGNLEAMVQELLAKVRDAEEQLREKEESIALLRDQTVGMARKLLLERQAPEGTEAAGPGTLADFGSLDLFGPTLRPERPAERKGRDGACPCCSGRLRKARCQGVTVLACPSCRGIFLETRSVRHLARTIPWMRQVEASLGSIPRGAPPSKAR